MIPLAFGNESDCAGLPPVIFVSVTAITPPGGNGDNKSRSENQTSHRSRSGAVREPAGVKMVSSGTTQEPYAVSSNLNDVMTWWFSLIVDRYFLPLML